MEKPTSKLEIQTIRCLDMVDPGHEILNRVADELTEAEIQSEYIQGVIDRMFEIANGKGHDAKDTRRVVGLAAPQIGLSKRIVLIDLSADGSIKEQELRAFINPKIVEYSADTMPGREGCWSTGNICGNVERAREIKFEALDGNGKSVSLILSGFVARIAQHETDHLDGIRFPDRIPVDEPDRLHWVEHDQFENYRKDWASWPVLCERDVWVELKADK